MINGISLFHQDTLKQSSLSICCPSCAHINLAILQKPNYFPCPIKFPVFLTENSLLLIGNLPEPSPFPPWAGASFPNTLCSAFTRDLWCPISGRLEGQFTALFGYYRTGNQEIEMWQERELHHKLHCICKTCQENMRGHSQHSTCAFHTYSHFIVISR